MVVLPEKDIRHKVKDDPEKSAFYGASGFEVEMILIMFISDQSSLANKQGSRLSQICR